MKKYVIVELEEGVWLAPWDGDPGRSIVEDNAKKFPTRSTAKRALKKAQELRPFSNAKLEAKKANINQGQKDA